MEVKKQKTECLPLVVAVTLLLPLILLLLSCYSRVTSALYRLALGSCQPLRRFALPDLQYSMTLRSSVLSLTSCDIPRPVELVYHFFHLPPSLLLLSEFLCKIVCQSLSNQEPAGSGLAQGRMISPTAGRLVLNKVTPSGCTQAVIHLSILGF